MLKISNLKGDHKESHKAFLFINLFQENTTQNVFKKFLK